VREETAGGRARLGRRGFLAGAGLSALGASGLLLTSCGGDDEEPRPVGAPASEPDPLQPRRGGILRTAGGPVGTVLDIHRAKAIPESLVWQWAGNFLMRYSASAPYLVEPDLAKSQPEIPGDGTLLVFRLRPEAKWQDRPPVGARPVTAEDVKASFERIKALAQKSPRSGNYNNVDSITAVDAATLQFKLKQPQADLLAIMADQYDLVIPKEVAARGDEAITGPADVIGSGPYELTAFDPGRRAQMRRRTDGHWKPNTAWLDGWDFLSATDDGQRANALFGGQADVAEVPPVLARVFEQDPAYQVLRATTPARECLLINHLSGPAKDPRVRMAISRAIDRRQVYGTVFEGAGVPGGPMTPAAAAWALPESELRQLPGFGDRATELTEAKKLLTAAGYPNGFEDKVITVDAMKMPFVTDVIVANLAEVGIRLKTEVVGSDFAALQERAKKGDFTFAATVLLAGMYPDAQLYLYHHSRNGAANFGKYANADVDAKLDKQRTIYRYEERLPIVQEIQRAIISNPGPAWIGSRVLATATTARVRNMVATPFVAGYDTAENAWLRS
jgi:peptide/nickel transport system substrate-binding protein